VTVPKVNINRLLPPAAEHEIEVITAIQNLANTVIANAASRSLARYVPLIFLVPHKLNFRLVDSKLDRTLAISSLLPKCFTGLFI